MRYPDTLKLYFIKPKRKITPARIKQLESILNNFGGIIITHSYRYGSGIEYQLRKISWNTGEIIFNLHRKDDDEISDNLK